MGIGKMISYAESKPFRDDHANCVVEETCGDRIVRILCKTHNKATIVSIPEKPDECESCKATAYRFMYGMWLCQGCLIREGNARTLDRFEKDKIAKAILSKDEKVNASLQIKEDIFNAETVALVELESAMNFTNSHIAEDERYYLFAGIVKTRILEYKRLITQKHEEILEVQSKVRAGQQHLNSIANKLRAEVREEFKIKDSAYKPEVVKPVKVKSAGSQKKTVSKAEVKMRVAKLLGEGISIANEYLFNMQLIRHNQDAEKAEGWIRKQFKEITSEIES